MVPNCIFKSLPQPLQATSKGKKKLFNNLDIQPPEKDSRSMQCSYSAISTSGLKAYLKCSWKTIFFLLHSKSRLRWKRNKRYFKKKVKLNHTAKKIPELKTQLLAIPRTSIPSSFSLNFKFSLLQQTPLLLSFEIPYFVVLLLSFASWVCRWECGMICPWIKYSKQLIGNQFMVIWLSLASRLAATVDFATGLNHGKQHFW